MKAEEKAEKRRKEAERMAEMGYLPTNSIGNTGSGSGNSGGSHGNQNDVTALLEDDELLDKQVDEIEADFDSLAYDNYQKSKKPRTAKTNQP